MKKYDPEKGIAYEDFISWLTEGGKCYLVQDIYGEKIAIYINEELTREIAEKTDQDPHLVSMLLACIKISRIDRDAYNKKSRKKISDDDLKDSIVCILNKYPASEVILVFRDLKYYEMTDIILSDRPLFFYEEHLK